MCSSQFRWPTPKRLWRRAFGDGFRGKVRLALVVLVAAVIVTAVIAGCSVQPGWNHIDGCIGFGC